MIPVTYEGGNMKKSMSYAELKKMEEIEDALEHLSLDDRARLIEGMKVLMSDLTFENMTVNEIFDGMKRVEKKVSQL